MAKADINLFRSAGGERAKATKRSPVTIMLLVGLIIVVAALGVAVYFNLKVNTAKSDYEKKEKILENYNRTLADPDVKTLSDEYKIVTGDIDSAAAINTYIESRSALYQQATPGEIKSIRKTIKNYPLVDYNLTTSVAEDEEDLRDSGYQGEYEAEETVNPIDYAALRAHLYDKNAPQNIDNRELIYYALEAVEKREEEDDEANVWYAYYRCYFVAVLTGGDSQYGLDELVNLLADPDSSNMGGQSPFSRYMVDDSYYCPVKKATIEFEDVNYHVLLLPLKTVIERAYDILEAHSNALVAADDLTDEQAKKFAGFKMNNIEFSNELLKFDLLLNEDVSFRDYMAEFDASHFFDVAWEVVSTEGIKTESPVNDDEEHLGMADEKYLNVTYSITLKYKNEPVSDADIEE